MYRLEKVHGEARRTGFEKTFDKIKVIMKTRSHIET